ncbi:hypothetical protein [Euzebya tangerina]|uniref:hypothetical protein n=1 Tax=Euzebya tangerina TaxID=591198 RepID=UPI000E313D93|nr:hypothetical protein [Euzebya tangerina]
MTDLPTTDQLVLRNRDMAWQLPAAAAVMFAVSGILGLVQGSAALGGMLPLCVVFGVVANNARAKRVRIDGDGVHDGSTTTTWDSLAALRVRRKSGDTIIEGVDVDGGRTQLFTTNLTPVDDERDPVEVVVAHAVAADLEVSET